MMNDSINDKSLYKKKLKASEKDEAPSPHPLRNGRCKLKFPLSAAEAAASVYPTQL